MEHLENQLQNSGDGSAGPFTYSRFLWLILALAVVAGVVFVAFVRPRQFSEAVDAQNGSNISSLERALDQLRDDSGGSLEGVIIGSGAIGSGAGEVNVCRALVPMYLVAMPVRAGAVGGGVGGGGHFRSCDDYKTGYVLVRDAMGALRVE